MSDRGGDRGLDSDHNGNVTYGASTAGWPVRDCVEEHMADGEDGGHGLEARVLALARGGMCRVEIGAALGLSDDELASLEAERVGFARAMRRAEVLERAWWEAAPREALAAGIRLNLGAWLGVMRWRWGDAEAAAAPPPPEAPPKRRVIFRIPCNGRTKLLPDGTCPCAADHDYDWSVLDRDDDDEDDEADDLSDDGDDDNEETEDGRI
jgi:hypothetical protein